MNKLNSTAIALAIGLALSGGATAQALSTDAYASGKKRIAAEYKSAKAACGSLAGNARDICKVGASGRENVAQADLYAKYKPSQGANYKARVARAKADYAVAREKCDDHAGNDKDVCIQEAKAAKVATDADAKAMLEISNANDNASQTVDAARAKAGEQRAAARDAAASEKRDAGYAVAREKCDAFSADARTGCIREAGVRFGKS